MQSISKAHRIGLAAGLLGLLLATACGGDGGGAGGAGGAGGQAGAADPGRTRGDGPVTMRFSWWGSDARHKATQQLIDLYESKNQGVTIEGDFTGFNDYWDRLATSTAGGKAPCIMQHESRYLREYADRKALLDLTPFIKDGTIDTGKLDQKVLSTGKIKDASFAIPTGVNAFSVVVDPKVYADTGVPLPDDERWTWDSLVDTAKQVSDRTPGDVWGMQAMGLNAADTNFEVYAREHGEKLFTEDGDVGFTKQTLVNWWNLEKRAAQSGAAPPPAVSVEVFGGGVDQALVATGRGAAGFWWTNELPALAKGAGRELQLRRFPSEAGDGKTGMYLKPAMFWAISNKCESPKEAALFLNWLINSPEAVEIIKADRGLPINTDLRAQISTKLDAPGKAAAAFIEKITPTLADPPPVPPKGAGEVQAILQRLNEQVLFDRMPVDQAADQFIREVKSAIT